MQKTSFGKFFLSFSQFTLFTGNKFDSQALAPVRRAASPTHIDLDEPADVIALQPELRAIAKEIAKNSQHTPQMNDEVPRPGADDVFLKVKWQPHPMDQHGKTRESQYKMDRVSLQAQQLESAYYAHNMLSFPSIIDRVKISVSSSRPPQTMLTLWLKISS
jgi:hypothetical protein